MRFQTDEEKREFPSLNLALRGVLVFADWYCQSHAGYAVGLMLTSCFRTRAQQAEINVERGDPPGKVSVHEVGRGADGRISDMPPGLASEIEAAVNRMFWRSDGKKTALLEADHIHFQVPPGIMAWGPIIGDGEV